VLSFGFIEEARNEHLTMERNRRCAPVSLADGKPKAMLAGANGNNSLGPSGTIQMSMPDVANWVRPAVARSPRHIKIGGLPSVIRDANC
jgi:hypothetical protein